MLHESADTSTLRAFSLGPGPGAGGASERDWTWTGISIRGWQPLAGAWGLEIVVSVTVRVTTMSRESELVLVVLADSEAANGRLRASGLSTFKSIAAGRPPFSRVHPSHEWRPVCVGSSSQLCPCPLQLNDQVKCGLCGVPVVRVSVRVGQDHGIMLSKQRGRRVAYNLAYIQSWQCT
jgi:hypothetical protein